MCNVKEGITEVECVGAGARFLTKVSCLGIKASSAL